MSEENVRLYEGLFLLAQGTDLGPGMQHIKDILDRAEAEVISLRKWDDRKLAYAIKAQKRGTFVLTYFNVRGTQIANIERDCNLSEQILRVLMTKAEHIGETELEQEKKETEERGLEAVVRDSGEGESANDAGASDNQPATEEGDAEQGKEQSKQEATAASE